MCEYDEAIACQYSMCSGDTQECPAHLCEKTFYDISHTTAKITKGNIIQQHIDTQSL